MKLLNSWKSFGLMGCQLGILQTAFGVSLPVQERLIESNSLTVTSIADRRAPSSFEVEQAAVAVRDTAVQTQLLDRAHLPSSARDEEGLMSACVEGPKAFLGWIFGPEEIGPVASLWPLENPLGRDPRDYCAYQVEMLAQLKQEEGVRLMDFVGNPLGPVLGLDISDTAKLNPQASRSL